MRLRTRRTAHRDHAGIRRSPLGTALDIMSPSGGARDPGVVSPSAYAVITSSAKDGEGGNGDPAGDPDRPRGSTGHLAAIRPSDAHVRVRRGYPVHDPPGAGLP